MTKSELMAEMKKAGIFDTNSRHTLWVQAFDLFQKETKQKLSMSCGSCYSKVRDFLRS